jgi:hypothetical protein
MDGRPRHMDRRAGSTATPLTVRARRSDVRCVLDRATTLLVRRSASDTGSDALRAERSPLRPRRAVELPSGALTAKDFLRQVADVP